MPEDLWGKLDKNTRKWFIAERRKIKTEQIPQRTQKEAPRPKSNAQVSTNQIPQQYAAAQRSQQEISSDVSHQEDFGFLNMFLAEDEDSLLDRSSYCNNVYHLSYYVDDMSDTTSCCFNMIHMADDQHMAIMDGGAKTCVIGRG